MAEPFKLSAPGALPWTIQDTVDYLNDSPLPTDFLWEGKAAVPAHRQVTGYGKWLKETPYHRGLFPLIHRLMAAADYLPRRAEQADSDELVRWIREALAAQNAQGSLF